jgi:urocanate hydratase
MVCADMSVQNFVGTAIRGATWVALHNGGGTGWGEAINGGFGVVLSGSQAEREKLRDFMLWDVANGVSRRSWAGGHNAKEYAQYLMQTFPGLQLTLPQEASPELLLQALPPDSPHP